MVGHHASTSFNTPLALDFLLRNRISVQTQILRSTCLKDSGNMYNPNIQIRAGNKKDSMLAEQWS
jgi:hypothetical protein